MRFDDMCRVLPILFNSEMVRAILDGRKKVTRRLVKKSQCTLLDKKEPSELKAQDLFAPFDGMTEAELIESIYREPYKPGDILYVRETWAFMPCIGCDGDYIREGGLSPCYDFQAVEYDDGDSISDGCFVYRADCKTPERIVWRPSIHMPKQAARIWLRVKDVRVERLQDIDDEGAKAEGANWKNGKHVGVEEKLQRSAIERFAEIWNGTIKSADQMLYGWDANPLVWVIAFERCEKPEPCIIRGVEPADDERPCIGYSVSEDDDEPCEMCKGCKVCSGNDN